MKERKNRMKFEVSIHYEGVVKVTVDAENEDAARKAAEKEFDEISAVELEANIEDITVSDVSEFEDEEDE